jgi:Cu(I)/Ag(I) efflux system membrane fusion protein
MKPIRIFSAIMLFLCATSFANAQNYKLDGPFLVKKTIKVYGDCEMCKHRIERAAKATPGVRYAHWDMDSQTLLVEYLRTRTNPEKIQRMIAARGHDTEKYEAVDTSYTKLPDCCHYRTAGN